ncbi:MAG: phosphoribosylformimino-5-aminoimidazole carboxamide ribotide isomerase [Victivallaceae bacterium]|nr:phosphoribosylformimino-5-aminoimidazole carboxamide ribotide isomerase [Victivallaceae bacterium]
MEFRPCIDLHQGKVKQLVGGTLTEKGPGTQVNFESELDAAYYAQLYCRDQLRGGHVIMLGPGNQEAARRALAAYPGGLQVGGGIDCGNAREWLAAGAAQVILTSYVFIDGELSCDRLERISAAVGRENLVLDLSCRSRGGKYYVVTDRWRKFTTCEVNAGTLNRLAGYCTEFLVHAVDAEGRRAGVDPDLIAILEAHSPLPAVYAGGVRSLEDIALIRQAGRNRIDFTVGSALDIFGGTLKYRDVVKTVRGKNRAI